MDSLKYIVVAGVKYTLQSVYDGDGNEISKAYVNLTGDQIISGIKTFTSEIKTNQIANENDNAMLRYKPTENKIVVGGSTIETTLMGKGERPTYSNDGSDFEGKELALLSDVSGGGLPTNPTDDGSYVLGNNVSSGESTHSWSSTESVDFVSLPAVDTSTDGTYTLKAIVSSGEVTFSWVKE